MIDPATLATYNSLETHGERNIFLMLMLIAEPVPKPNVAGIVKMDRTYCKELLDKLVKDGIIAEFEKFGIRDLLIIPFFFGRFTVSSQIR